VSALHYFGWKLVSEGFGQWLQLVCCATLLLQVQVISIINVHKFRTEHRLKSKAKLRVFPSNWNQISECIQAIGSWSSEVFPIDGIGLQESD